MHSLKKNGYKFVKKIKINNKLLNLGPVKLCAHFVSNMTISVSLHLLEKEGKHTNKTNLLIQNNIIKIKNFQKGSLTLTIQKIKKLENQLEKFIYWSCKHQVHKSTECINQLSAK